MSAIFATAVETYRECRAEFGIYLEAMYQAAEIDCNAVLLNRRGEAKGIDPFSLFYGPRTRVDAYASEELRNWFDRYGRTTYQQWEAEWHERDR